MATFLRFLTLVCMLSGGAANAYIWHITKGTATAWDFVNWEKMFHNMWARPLDMTSIILAVAIFPTVFAGLVISAWLATKLGGRNGKVAKAEVSPEVDQESGKSKVPFRGIVISSLGKKPEEAAEETKRGPSLFDRLKLRAADTAQDLKDAFGIDVDGWRRNRMRARGEDKIVPVAKKEKASLASLFSRKKAPAKKTVAPKAEPAVITEDPRKEIAFEVMEWFGVWGKAGVSGRTESMSRKAHELREKLTVEAQAYIMENHGYTGDLAIQALIGATREEKGIGAFAEDTAAPVAQPEVDELIDTDLHTTRAEAAFGDSADIPDEEFQDDQGDEESGEGAPEHLQRQPVDPDNLRNFFDRYREDKPEGDGLDVMRKAGQGTPQDFLNTFENPVAGEGREGQAGEGSDGEGNGSSSTDGASGGDWADSMPWETTPASETTDAPETADDEMPAGHAWTKFKPQDTEVDAALKEPAAPAGDFPAWGSESDTQASDTPVSDTPETTGATGGDFPAWADEGGETTDTNTGEGKASGDTGAPQEWTGDQAEEDGAVSALLASISPNGPIPDASEEDLIERPEDLATPASTKISPEEMDKTIRKMDKNWLRFVTGEVDKGARTLERQFVQAGLADLKSRHVFLPALWASLNKVVDYQTQAYSWEHFGDTPPENLRTAKQRAEFLFDAVTAIVALAKQVPADDLQELLTLKAGTEQARWLAAGRAERLVSELKKSGAVEPGQTAENTGGASQGPDLAETRREARADDRSMMAEAAMAMSSRTTPAPAAPVARGEPESIDIPDEELVEDGNWDGRGWEPDYQGESSPYDQGDADEGDQGHQTLPSPTNPNGDTPQAPETPVQETTPPNGPSSEPLTAEQARKLFLDEIVSRANKDGLKARLGMRFSAGGSSASEIERTADVVIGKEMVEVGQHRIPNGRRLVVAVVIDVPEGQWRVGKGENGRPQLKWAGKVIELRTWAFRLADAFFKQRDVESVRNVLILRMDPIATIEDGEGNADRDAVANLVAETIEGEISVRVGAWSPSEWREQVVLPVLG